MFPVAPPPPVAVWPRPPAVDEPVVPMPVVPVVVPIPVVVPRLDPVAADPPPRAVPLVAVVAPVLAEPAAAATVLADRVWRYWTPTAAATLTWGR